MTQQENELKPQCATCGTPSGHYNIYLNLLKKRRELEIFTHRLEEEMTAQSQELEQLRAENERLRGWLCDIKICCDGYLNDRINAECAINNICDYIEEIFQAPTNNKAEG
jgi:hypothetical protein